MARKKDPIPQYIAEFWADRFHRNEEKTKKWMFFVSRPTFELLRRTDKKGRQAYLDIKEFVTKFIDDTREPNNRTSLKYNTQKTGQDDNGYRYATAVYPFNLSRESFKPKIGVIIHLGVTTSDVVERQEEILLGEEITMFDELEEAQIIHAPPGIYDKQYDPMWNNFQQSKMLPTEFLIGEESYDWQKFRLLMSRQFMEMRILNGTGAESEQYDALKRFEEAESGFTNFYGLPGTGKSTLLHMISAHRLVLNEVSSQDDKDKKKALYMTPTANLKNEAEQEVKSILKTVYERVQKDWDNIEGEIQFITQEDLFLISPKPEYDLLSKQGEKGFRDKILKLDTKNLSKEHFFTFINKAFRNLIFGVFGSPTEFERWVHINQNEKEKAWVKDSLSLTEPLKYKTPGSNGHPLRMNDFFKYDKKIIKSITDVLKNSNVPILDYESGVLDGYWDRSAAIHASYLRHLKSEQPFSFWSLHKGSVDYLIIDEIQDFSVTEIRILLHHFSNRQTDQDFRTFRMVVGGDEFQTVKGTAFRPQNDHIKYTYMNWRADLKHKLSREELGECVLENGSSTRTTKEKCKELKGKHIADGVYLSNGLDYAADNPLRMSYRVFTEMVDISNDIVSEMNNKFYDISGNRKKIRHSTEMKQTNLQKTIVSRKGLLYTAEKAVTTTPDWTEKVFTTLIEQLESKKTIPTVRVVLIYDEAQDWSYLETEHPLEGLRKLQKDEFHFVPKEFENELKNICLEKIKQFKGNSKKNKVNAEHDLKIFLEQRGIMSVKAVKGLTTPVAIVIPVERGDSNFLLGKKVENKITSNDIMNQQELELYSKLLVQVTRSQYANFLLKSSTRMPDNHPSIHTTSEEIKNSTGDWLNRILQNAGGVSTSLANTFAHTLTNYQSTSAWEYLQAMVKDLGDDFYDYINWLKNVHIALIERPLENSEIIKLIQETKPKDFLSIEKSYGLGIRTDGLTLASLKIFMMCNSIVREMEANKWVHKIVIDNFKQWLDNLNHQSTNQKLARDWFTLFAYPELVKQEGRDGAKIEYDLGDNAVLKALEHLPWGSGAPSLELGIDLPRITKGAWQIIPPEDDQSEKNAWMVPESTTFQIPVTVIEKILDWGESQDSSRRLSLLLSIIQLDAFGFANALEKCVLSNNPEERQQTWDWFFEVFKDVKTEDNFKSNVIKAILEKAAINKMFRTSMTRSIASSPSNTKIINRLKILYGLTNERPLERSPHTHTISGELIFKKLVDNLRDREDFKNYLIKEISKVKQKGRSAVIKIKENFTEAKEKGKTSFKSNNTKALPWKGKGGLWTAVRDDIANPFSSEIVQLLESNFQEKSKTKAAFVFIAKIPHCIKEEKWSEMAELPIDSFSTKDKKNKGIFEMATEWAYELLEKEDNPSRWNNYCNHLIGMIDPNKKNKNLTRSFMRFYNQIKQKREELFFPAKQDMVYRKDLDKIIFGSYLRANIDNRLFNRFIQRCLFNKFSSAGDKITLKEYVNSSIGHMIYYHLFSTNSVYKEDEIEKYWRESFDKKSNPTWLEDGYSEQNAHFLDHNDDIRRLKNLHIPSIPNGEEGVFEERFANRSTLNAFIHLSVKSPNFSEIGDAFGKGGLFNHKLATKLHHFWNSLTEMKEKRRATIGAISEIMAEEKMFTVKYLTTWSDGPGYSSSIKDRDETENKNFFLALPILAHMGNQEFSPKEIHGPGSALIGTQNEIKVDSSNSNGKLFLKYIDDYEYQNMLWRLGTYLKTDVLEMKNADKYLKALERFKDELAYIRNQDNEYTEFEWAKDVGWKYRSTEGEDADGIQAKIISTEEDYYNDSTMKMREIYMFVRSILGTNPVIKTENFYSELLRLTNVGAGLRSSLEISVPKKSDDKQEQTKEELIQELIPQWISILEESKIEQDVTSKWTQNLLENPQLARTLLKAWEGKIDILDEGELSKGLSRIESLED